MFRILRVLRVLRLMRSWQGLYLIVSTFVKALQQMRNLLVLMALVIGIFALLGMQVWEGHASGGRSRQWWSRGRHPR